MGKKKLIFNGCSLTYGAESVHDGIDQHLDNFNNSYPMLIQKKLKNIEVINLASCGKSNSQMFCQNIDYLMESISNEDELIFITQWSWVERFPKVVSVKNINKFEKTAEWLSFLKYYSDQEHGISTIADYDGRHDTWVDADLNMEEHNVQYNLLANMSLTMLLSYINLLDTYNVKNLNYITQLLTTDEMKVSNRFQEGNNDFTSTYDLNCITEEILKHKNFLMDDWITEFICKPKFLRKNSHASAEAHQLWANKLLKILIDKKYISRTDIR
jgi:mannose/fructose-specific phosphotransferase system component IIA